MTKMYDNYMQENLHCLLVAHMHHDEAWLYNAQGRICNRAKFFQS